MKAWSCLLFLVPGVAQKDSFEKLRTCFNFVPVLILLRFGKKELANVPELYGGR
jgi:hypothetical protein